MSISNPPKPIHLTPYYILHLHTCSRPKASQQTGNDLEPLLFVVPWSKKKAQAQAHIFYFLFFSCSFTCLWAASLYSLSLLFISFYFFSLLLFVSLGCFSLFFILYLCFLFLSFYFTCGLLFIPLLNMQLRKNAVMIKTQLRKNAVVIKTTESTRRKES